MTEKDALPTYAQPESSGEENEKPRLSPIQRLGAIFMSPGEVFADVKRKPNFVLPILAAIAITILFGYFCEWRAKIDPREFVGRMNEIGLERQGKRMRDLNEQEQKQMEQIADFAQTMHKFAPVVITIRVVFSIAFLALIFFVGTLLVRGQTDFKRVLSVTAYAYFVTETVKWVLSAVIVLIRPPGIDQLILSGGNYAISSPVALMSLESPPWLLTLAGNFDALALWFMALIAIGLAAVSYKKRVSQMAVIPFGLWFLLMMATTAFVLVTSKR